MRLFQFARMLWHVGRSLRTKRKFGERLASLPMSELVPAWIEHMNKNPLMEFTEADELIALEVPREGRCIAVLAAPWHTYPAGTVFDIENLIATRHADMSAWLGATAALFFEGR